MEIWWWVLAAWGLLGSIAVLVLARMLRRMPDPDESVGEAAGGIASTARR
jgi:hypothetical protein